MRQGMAIGMCWCWFVHLAMISSLQAQDTNLQLEVAALAADVSRSLGDEKAVAVGDFTASSNLPASAGPAVTLALRRELTKLGFSVSEGARLRVEGKYADVIDKQSEELAVALVAELLVAKTRKPVDGIRLRPRGVFGEVAVAALLGANVEYPPQTNRKERDKMLRVALDHPTVKIHSVSKKGGNTSEPVQAAAPGSSLRLEILVKGSEGFVPRALSDHAGSAFVALARDDVYAVKIVNDHDFEVAVQLFIDGLSVFSFAEGINQKTGRPYVCVVVGPKDSAVVKGWYRDEKAVNEFLVAEYARSAAAELKSTAKVGSITAAYSACWPKDGTPPPDEPAVRAAHSDAIPKSGEATARGLLIQNTSESVARVFGVNRGSVSIRYVK